MVTVWSYMAEKSLFTQTNKAYRNPNIWWFIPLLHYLNRPADRRSGKQFGLVSGDSWPNLFLLLTDFLVGRSRFDYNGQIYFPLVCRLLLKFGGRIQRRATVCRSLSDNRMKVGRLHPKSAKTAGNRAITKQQSPDWPLVDRYTDKLPSCARQGTNARPSDRRKCSTPITI